MDEETHEPPEDDGDAAQAFEALREEVAALRRGVELIYRQGLQTSPAVSGAPDYSLTLGKMEKALQTIAGRLEAVERQPALSLTPGSFRVQIEAVAQSAVTILNRPIVTALSDVQTVTQDLKALVGRVHAKREQRIWLIIASGYGLVVGIGLWYVAAGLLPRSAGDWIAASLIGGDRWQAGVTLMEEASPASWDRMRRLYKACGEATTDLCEAAIAVRSQQTGPPRAAGGEAGKAGNGGKIK